MRELVPGGILVIGALTFGYATIRGSSALIRVVRARRAFADDPMRRTIVTLEYAYSALLIGVVAGIGVFVIVVGVVVDSGAQAWTLVLPLGMIGSAAANAWLVRGQLARLRRSSQAQEPPRN